MMDDGEVQRKTKHKSAPWENYKKDRDLDAKLKRNKEFLQHKKEERQFSRGTAPLKARGDNAKISTNQKYSVMRAVTSGNLKPTPVQYEVLKAVSSTSPKSNPLKTKVFSDLTLAQQLEIIKKRNRRNFDVGEAETIVQNDSVNEDERSNNYRINSTTSRPSKGNLMKSIEIKDPTPRSESMDEMDADDIDNMDAMDSSSDLGMESRNQSWREDIEMTKGVSTKSYGSVRSIGSVDLRMRSTKSISSGASTERSSKVDTHRDSEEEKSKPEPEQTLTKSRRGLELDKISDEYHHVKFEKLDRLSKMARSANDPSSFTKGNDVTRMDNALAKWTMKGSKEFKN